MENVEGIPSSADYDVVWGTIRYDTKEQFNVDSEAE